MASLLVDFTHVVLTMYLPELIFVLNFKYEANRPKHRLGGLIGDTKLNPFMPVWIVTLSGLLMTVIFGLLAGKIFAETIVGWISGLSLLSTIFANILMISNGLFLVVYFREGLEMDKRLLILLIVSFLSLAFLVYNQGIV
jgi:hypothetical protein